MQENYLLTPSQISFKVLDLRVSMLTLLISTEHKVKTEDQSQPLLKGILVKEPKRRALLVFNKKSVQFIFQGP